MPPSRNLFNPKEYQTTQGQVPRRSAEGAILVFDVVGFSAQPINEKMIAVVREMHDAIWTVLEPRYYWAERKQDAPKNNLLLIPTGDGYGIALGAQLRDEVILDIAAGLWRELNRQNLKIRMGVGKSPYVVTVDLNNNVNVFGHGIVLATRICSAAREGEILVESGFAERLLRDKTIAGLEPIAEPFRVKHDQVIHCHNYHRAGDFGTIHG